MQTRPKLPSVFLALLASVILVPALSGSSGKSASGLRPGNAEDFVRAVLMQTDRRADPYVYAANSGIGGDELRRRYGASGLVRCGAAVGSGQLTLRNDIITTAAHVLYDKEGRLRSEACTFEPLPGSGMNPIALDLRSMRVGSSNPYAEPATRDWAVVRLTVPAEGARPYSLGAIAANSLPVFMCAGGNGRGGVWGAERCATREVTKISEDGIRELTIDCSADHGASGAALVSDKDDIVAIYVGYRSTAPKAARPYSSTHYNFAITIDGPFRRALLEFAAGPES